MDENFLPVIYKGNRFLWRIAPLQFVTGVLLAAGMVAGQFGRAQSAGASDSSGGSVATLQVLNQATVNAGTHSITYQRIAPPPAAAPAAQVSAPPLSTLTLQPAQQKPFKFAFLVATVYDGQFTEVNWMGPGPGFQAFSNINFNFFIPPIFEFETTDAIYSCFFITVNDSVSSLTASDVAVPDFSSLPVNQSGYVPIGDTGFANAQAQSALDALDAYFDANRGALTAQYQTRQAAMAAQAGQPPANPPPPPNSVISFWPKKNSAYLPPNN